MADAFLQGVQGFKLNWRTSGFTMVEMLVVLAIIGILAALLLPALTGSKKRAKRIVCETQLQQIGIAFQSFSHDHNSKFPMQVSTNDGGAMEFFEGSNLTNSGTASDYRNFQSLGGILGSPDIFICPADTRLPAANFIVMQNSNVSYFAGLNASYDQPMSILAGDGNLTTPATLVVRNAGSRLAWNKYVHEFKGNVLFSDGHVEEWKDGADTLASAVTIIVPTTTTTGGGGGGSGGGATASGSGGRSGGSTGAGSPSSQPAAPPNTFTPMSGRVAQAGTAGSPGNPAPEAAGPAMLHSSSHQNTTSVAAWQTNSDDSNSIPEVAVVTNELPETNTPSPVDTTSDMSPGNRQAASIFRDVLAGGYLTILFFVLAYAVYRFRRWRQEVERKRRLKLARARMFSGS